MGYNQNCQCKMLYNYTFYDAKTGNECTYYLHYRLIDYSFYTVKDLSINYAVIVCVSIYYIYPRFYRSKCIAIILFDRYNNRYQ